MLEFTQLLPMYLLHFMAISKSTKYLSLLILPDGSITFTIALVGGAIAIESILEKSKELLPILDDNS